MIKNFGLNLDLVNEPDERKCGSMINWAATRRQAKKDFAEYDAMFNETRLAEKEAQFQKLLLQVDAKRRRKETETVFSCHSFICNWKGLKKRLTRGGCPNCGAGVFRRRLWG